MMTDPTTDDLTAALGRRIAACREFTAGASHDGDVAVALVLARLDLPAIVRGTLRCCASLAPELARRWVGNFTKALVLVGEPRKLAARFAFAAVDEAGAAAWIGPDDARRLEPLRRLVRPLRTAGALDLPDLTVRRPCAPEPAGAARPALITMATAGLLLEDYLVSLMHTLAEAELLGHLAGATDVAVRHVDVLDAVPASASYARVHKGKAGDPTLRLYATVIAPS